MRERSEDGTPSISLFPSFVHPRPILRERIGEDMVALEQRRSDRGLRYRWARLGLRLSVRASIACW
jgi:hypothetical protein